MRLGVAGDHGGFDLKENLVAELRSLGHEVVPIRKVGMHTVGRACSPDRGRMPLPQTGVSGWPRGSRLWRLRAEPRRRLPRFRCASRQSCRGGTSGARFGCVWKSETNIAEIRSRPTWARFLCPERCRAGAKAEFLDFCFS